MQSLSSTFPSLDTLFQSQVHQQKSKTRTLHLFRALLRQCTYLPDPTARSCLHAHVVSRFRDYSPNKPKIKHGLKRKPIKLIEARQPRLLKAAQKGLLFLQRANHGHPLQLRKVLAMAYGRVGKRRHELLKALKLPDVIIDAETVQQLSHPTNQEVPLPSKQFLALVKSQLREKQQQFLRAPVRHASPTIPEQNSWGRPMPVKRVRNMKRRWYAETLDRIMPPLPDEEWKRLQALASGEMLWEGPRRRRGPIAEEKALESARFNGGRLSRPHQITQRYMQRLWGGIFMQCPKMNEVSSLKAGWDVVWGDPVEARVIGLGPRATFPSSAFEGVDGSGKIIRK